jgi:hypothetical protein
MGEYPENAPVAMNRTMKDGVRPLLPGDEEFSIEFIEEFSVIEQVHHAGPDGGDGDQQHHPEQYLGVHQRLDDLGIFGFYQWNIIADIKNKDIVDDDKFTECLCLGSL